MTHYPRSRPAWVATTWGHAVARLHRRWLAMPGRCGAACYLWAYADHCAGYPVAPTPAQFGVGPQQAAGIRARVDAWCVPERNAA